MKRLITLSIYYKIIRKYWQNVICTFILIIEKELMLYLCRYYYEKETLP